MRNRRGMYGYSPKLFFSYLMREIVLISPEEPKEIHIFNHQDSVILRLYGNDIKPNASDFILNRDWTVDEPNGEKIFS